MIKILLYHNILNDPQDPSAVIVDNFKMQMKWIADNGYNVISLKEALKSLNNNDAPKKSIVFTFDDGFIDFIETALPVLNKYDFCATVFIVVSEVGGFSSWQEHNLNRRLMNWKSLKEIICAGHTIGSHGLHHYDLTKLAQRDLDKEVVASKEIIQEKLGIEVDSFSYPWGICTRREINRVKKAGYNCAAGVVRHGYNTYRANRFLLKRIVIEQKDSLGAFIKKII